MASVKFPSFPSVDFSKLDLSKLDFSKVDLSKLDFTKLPKIELPKIELPKIERPTIDVPSIDLPKIEAETLVNAARDAAYIGIGVAVLAFQKAQVLRRDAGKTFNDHVTNNKAQIDGLVGHAQGAAKAASKQVRDRVKSAAS